MSAFKNQKGSVMKFALILILLLSLNGISGQAPVDFSGTWQADLAKCNPEYSKYYEQMNLSVKQTDQTFAFARITTSKSGDKASQEPMVYSLDGKETQKEQYGGIDKVSAAWSADKNELKLKMVRTVDGQDYGSVEIWSLSHDGKVLTLLITDLKGETQLKEVYNKQ